MEINQGLPLVLRRQPQDRQKVPFARVLRHLLLASSAVFGFVADVTAQIALEPELRQRVEQLKADLERSPTTPENLAERAAVLWDWNNAFALQGGYVPVNLTAAVRPGVAAGANAAAGANLDAFIRELALHDEEPQAIGDVTATLGPYVARSYATVQQTYTVGTRPIERGGGLVVANHFMADHGTFQTDRPDQANYVSIRSSNPAAQFEITTEPMRGMHGGFRGAAPVLFFRLAAGTLNQGDTLTVTYGGRAEGGPGLLMPTMSSDRMPFPLYLKLNADSLQYSLPIQPIRVVGAEVSGVHGFAPSVVRPGESFDLSIRAEDTHVNRATGPIPEWHVFSNGNQIGTIAAGDQALTKVENLRFAEEGVQRIEIRSAAGAIKGVANPILVSSTAQKVFWGDTHGHSGFAEGIGTPDRFMTWARDDARLDFVTHSEHDIWLDDYEWEVLRENVAKYSKPGEFVAFLGYEWTARNLYGGHHNVLFRTPEDRPRVGAQFYPVLSELYTGLHTLHDPNDVIVIPHAHQAGDYRMSDPQLEPLVEIMSQHGTFEWFGRMYLSHGHRVGFTAASDNHLSQPGYTSPKGSSLSQRGGLGAVLAEEATVDGLFDAMKQLRAYATSGERIILDFRVNDGAMGQRIEFSEDRQITGRVIGTAPISSIAIVKNDEILWEEDYLTKTETDAGRDFAEREKFLVTFYSQSIPMQRGDNPRGWRPWDGVLTVEGAKLLRARATDFDNIARSLEVDSTNPNQLRFSTNTRGDSSSIELDLEGVSEATKITLNLEARRETGGAPPIYRRPANLPASTVELSVSQLERGLTQQALPFDIYQDTVTLRRRRTDGQHDVAFSVTDTSKLQGDYYFLRVVQADDSIAWSSPIWVGGYSPK